MAFTARSGTPGAGWLGGGRTSQGGGLTLDIRIDGRAESDLSLAFQGRLAEVAEEELDRLRKAYTAAAHRVKDKGKARLRADIVAGGFFNAVRLSKTWRGTAYPRLSKGSLEPGIYYANKARVIIEAFSMGATITVRNAKFLAIPTGPAKAIVRRMNRQVAKASRGSGFGRDTGGRFTELGNPVARVAQALGVELVPIISKDGRHGVLVARSQATLTKSGLLARNQDRAATVLFVLTRQATLKKRIRGPALLEEMKRAFPGEFAAALAQTLAPENRG